MSTSLTCGARSYPSASRGFETHLGLAGHSSSDRVSKRLADATESPSQWREVSLSHGLGTLGLGTHLGLAGHSSSDRVPKMPTSV